MSGILTAEEQAFLKKKEEQKQRHKEAAAIYRANNEDKIKDYNKKYNDDQKSKLDTIKTKKPQQPQLDKIRVVLISSNFSKIIR